MVLVYDRMNTGGIETMMLRMVDWLVARSMPVVVCCLPGGDLQARVSPKAVLINYTDSGELVAKMRQWCVVAKPAQILLMSFDSAPAARALMLESAMSGMTVVHNVTGVFHPKSYFMPGQPADRRWLNRKILGAYGGRHVFFMNRESLDLHAGFMSARYDKAAVIPIPVEVQGPKWAVQPAAELRVVSVGRLVDFKAYNLGAASIVKHCAKRGVRVLWDIYGYGPQYDLIEQAIAQEGVAGQVFLKGALEYENLFKVIAGYDVFIGMGTSVVEAAAIGMPSLVAQVESPNRSHGYLHELPFGNIGEVIESDEPDLIEDKLCEHAMWSASQRQTCADACMTAAARYSVDDFMHAVISLGREPVSASLRLRRRCVARLSLSLLDGWVARHLLGRGLASRLKRLVRP
jgi:hypothetical protein